MKQLTFLLLLVFSYSLTAQIDNFDISQYVYPDIKRQTLRLSPSFNGFNEGDVDEEDELDINFGAVVDYDLINFNRSVQSTFRIYNNLGYAISNENSPSDFDRDGLSNYSSVNYTYRKFYKPKRFFELQSSLSHNTYKYLNTDRYSSFTAHLSPKLGIGRIEIVQDAWAAVTLFEHLRDNNILLREPTEDEINNLAIEISKITNLRVIDFRLEDIAEQERLIKYFIENEFVDPNNYAFYPILLDAYNFESFRIRNHGFMFKYGLNYSKYRRGRSNELEDDGSVSLALQYQNDKAININWQFNQSYTILAGKWFYQTQIEPYNGFKYDFNFIEISGNVTVRNYISRRIYYAFGVNGFYRRLKDYVKIGSLSLNGSLEYYFSPRTQMSISGFLYLTRRNYDFDVESGYHQEYLNWSLNHFIF